MIQLQKHSTSLAGFFFFMIIFFFLQLIFINCVNMNPIYVNLSFNLHVDRKLWKEKNTFICKNMRDMFTCSKAWWRTTVSSAGFVLREWWWPCTQCSGTTRNQRRKTWKGRSKVSSYIQLPQLNNVIIVLFYHHTMIRCVHV